jgi:hypothetical protein
MKGEPISLDEPCMTILWFTQPEKCVRLLENSSLSDGGFLPRCLMSDTKAEPMESEHDGIPIPAEVRQRFHELINDLYSTYLGSSDPFHYPGVA